MKKSVTVAMALEVELAACLLASDPVALARVNAAHPLTEGRAFKQKPLVARVGALRAAIAKTPPRAPAGTSKSFKPASPAAAPSTPAISTATLEKLARTLFGHAGLPRLDDMDDSQKRLVLTKELWQAHVSIPGITDAPGLSAKHWRQTQLSGVPRILASFRQQQAAAFLRSHKH